VLSAAALPALVSAVCIYSISAQEHTTSPAVRLSAEGTALFTAAIPAVGGDSRSEAYLTRPMLMAHAHWQAVRTQVMANLEGWTLDRGELNAGTAGEGYMDRRHPHTFLHEAMVSATGTWSGVSASVAMGRGFAPFGTDDPMVRPFVKYPANHHLAQLLERWQAIAALQARGVSVEAALFQGDEPIGPRSLGRISRFADSWSARVTWHPVSGLELQGSAARVESPEHALGGGLDHRKWSFSVRGEVERDSVLRLYGLLEWARTGEYSGNARAFVFQSVLAEAAVVRGASRFAARFERTTRPEEERLADPFRSARPHADDNIIGVTRWHIVTARVDREMTVQRLTLQPFAEAAWLHVAEITGSFFEPVTFYGNDSLWNLSLGVRVSAGAPHERAGRYGAAAILTGSSQPGHHE
jgi:hypothetical protein